MINNSLDSHFKNTAQRAILRVAHGWLTGLQSVQDFVHHSVNALIEFRVFLIAHHFVAVARVLLALRGSMRLVAQFHPTGIVPADRLGLSVLP